MQWKKLFSPSFTIAAVLLLASTFGLQRVVDELELFLRKQPVPLRAKLYEFPRRLGPYVRVKQRTLPSQVVEELGTDKYLCLVYYNEQLPKSDPAAFVDFSFAYYTGTPDAVPHVPERCYVGGRGVRPVDSGVASIHLNIPASRIEADGEVWTRSARNPEVRLPATDLQVSMFSFENPETGQTNAVTYFYVVNGDFEARPSMVKARVFDLRSRYAYFCKIDILPATAAPMTREASRQVAEHFLSYALPEVFAYLPDWAEVKAGRYPPGDN